MPTLDRIARAADRRAATLIRQLRARRSSPVQTTDLELRSTVGYHIAAQVHRVFQSKGRQPGILLCPGIHDPGTSFSTWMPPITAAEVARLGCTVLTFDPTGRGKSWGDEDYGGPEHHDNALVALHHLAGRTDVDPTRLGVVSISQGIAMAVGALSNPDAPNVRWLLDWEGPCDREILTSGGSIMIPANGHSMDDNVYWNPREAVRQVPGMRCAYVRLQAEQDHAQPGEFRHARRMLHAVSLPESTVRWFQLNNHPRGQVPDRPHWLPSGKLSMNRIMLQKIAALVAER